MNSTTTMETTSIIKATDADIPQLVQLVNGAYRGESSRQGWTTEADLLDGIRINEETLQDSIRRENTTILKYMQDDKLIGCVLLEKQQDKLYLGMLTVSPLVQNKGIGKQLIKASEDVARQSECTKIVMTVITTRHELIAWYERAGFKRTGEIKPFPDDSKFGIPKQPLQFEVLKKVL